MMAVYHQYHFRLATPVTLSHDADRIARKFKLDTLLA